MQTDANVRIMRMPRTLRYANLRITRIITISSIRVIRQLVSQQNFVSFACH